jgi:hypothetical protein
MRFKGELEVVIVIALIGPTIAIGSSSNWNNRLIKIFFNIDPTTFIMGAFWKTIVIIFFDVLIEVIPKVMNIREQTFLHVSLTTLLTFPPMILIVRDPY